MTKKELVKKLKDFKDKDEIVIGNWGQWSSIVNVEQQYDYVVLIEKPVASCCSFYGL